MLLKVHDVSQYWGQYRALWNNRGNESSISILQGLFFLREVVNESHEITERISEWSSNGRNNRLYNFWKASLETRRHLSLATQLTLGL